MRHDRTISITLRVTGDDSRDEADLVSRTLAWLRLKHASERPLLELHKAHNFVQAGAHGAKLIGSIEVKDMKATAPEVQA